MTEIEENKIIDLLIKDFNKQSEFEIVSEDKVKIKSKYFDAFLVIEETKDLYQLNDSNIIKEVSILPTFSRFEEDLGIIYNEKNFDKITFLIKTVIETNNYFIKVMLNRKANPDKRLYNFIKENLETYSEEYSYLIKKLNASKIEEIVEEILNSKEIKFNIENEDRKNLKIVAEGAIYKYFLKNGEDLKKIIEGENLKTLNKEELKEIISKVLIERIIENGFKEKEINKKILETTSENIINKKCLKYKDEENKSDYFIFRKEDLLNLMKYLKYEELESLDKELEKYTKEAYKLRKDLKVKREEIEDRLRKTKDDEERNILRKFLNQFENDLSPQEMAILKKQLNGIDFMADKIKDQLASYFK
jgi:hypothetical protein